MSVQKGTVIQMSIMNLFTRNASKDNKNIYNLHKAYAEKRMSRQEYCDELLFIFLREFLSEDAMRLLKKKHIDVMAVDKNNIPDCTAQELLLLTQECRRAANCTSRLFDTVKERMLQKDRAAEHFSERFKNVEVIPSSKWKGIYENEPLKLYPDSMHNIESLWDHFVAHTSTLKMLLPMIASKYAEMLGAGASFDCEQ